MKMKKYLAIIATLVCAMGVMGCNVNINTGSSDADEQVEEATEEVAAEEATEEVEDEDTEEEEAIEEAEAEEDAEEDAEVKPLEAGVYYFYSSDEVDGVEYGSYYYLVLNEDGTGTWAIQDIVPITWTENEIVTDFSPYEARIEGDKLVVSETSSDEEYEKLPGKLVQPYPVEVDENDIPDGIYPAYIGAVEEKDGELTARIICYSEDWYDIVDVNTLEVDDAIIADGVFYLIETVDNNNGKIVINGGDNEGGAELINPEDSNGYRYFGFDDRSAYTQLFMKEFVIDKKAVLKDSFDSPGEVQEISYDEMLDSFNGDPYFNEYNTTVLIENGVIVEIERVFTP